MPPARAAEFAAGALPGADHRRGGSSAFSALDCRTLHEQRAIQAEKARVLRRLKRGLSL
jgi:hypothetical protein